MATSRPVGSWQLARPVQLGSWRVPSSWELGVCVYRGCPRCCTRASRSACSFFASDCCSGVSRPKISVRRRACWTCHLGLRLGKLLRCRTDQLLVDRHSGNGFPLRVHRGTQALRRRTVLRTILLRQCPDLLLLRVTEIEGAQRQAAAGTEATAAAWSAAGIGPRRLRIDGGASQQAREYRRESERTKTIHRVILRETTCLMHWTMCRCHRSGAGVTKG